MGEGGEGGNAGGLWAGRTWSWWHLRAGRKRKAASRPTWGPVAPAQEPEGLGSCLSRKHARAPCCPGTLGCRVQKETSWGRRQAKLIDFGHEVWPCDGNRAPRERDKLPHRVGGR